MYVFIYPLCTQTPSPKPTICFQPSNPPGGRWTLWRCPKISSRSLKEVDDSGEVVGFTGSVGLKVESLRLLKVTEGCNWAVGAAAAFHLGEWEASLRKSLEQRLQVVELGYCTPNLAGIRRHSTRITNGMSTIHQLFSGTPLKSVHVYGGTF